MRSWETNFARLSLDNLNPKQQPLTCTNRNSWESKPTSNSKAKKSLKKSSNLHLWCKTFNKTCKDRLETQNNWKIKFWEKKRTMNNFCQLRKGKEAIKNLNFTNWKPGWTKWSCQCRSKTTNLRTRSMKRVLLSKGSEDNSSNKVINCCCLKTLF